MKTFQRGIDLIKMHEGCKLTSYCDPVTRGDPWTFGFGSAHDVHPNMVITMEDAERMLVADLAVYEAMTEKGLHVKVTQNM
jgi:lysozyme